MSEGKKIKDWFEKEEDFTAMLEAAEANAQVAWDITFIDNLTLKVSHYGTETYLSEDQYEQLQRIAGL